MSIYTMLPHWKNYLVNHAVDFYLLHIFGLFWV